MFFFCVFQEYMSQRATKPTISLVQPAETQISLRISAILSESSLIACTFDSLQAIQLGSNANHCHTGLIYRMIWVIASCTGLIVVFVSRAGSDNPVSILYKSIAGSYRPVSYPDGPTTARYRFIKNAYWEWFKWTTDVLIITKTCLYNFDPLKPHFYIVKLGFIGVYIIFLISAQKHRLWVLVRTASPAVLTSTHNLCFEQKNEKYPIFFSENFHFFCGKIFSIFWIGVFS